MTLSVRARIHPCACVHIPATYAGRVADHFFQNRQIDRVANGDFPRVGLRDQLGHVVLGVGKGRGVEGRLVGGLGVSRGRFLVVVRVLI